MIYSLKFISKIALSLTASAAFVFIGTTAIRAASGSISSTPRFSNNATFTINGSVATGDSATIEAIVVEVKPLTSSVWGPGCYRDPSTYISKTSYTFSCLNTVGNQDGDYESHIIMRDSLGRTSTFSCLIAGCRTLVDRVAPLVSNTVANLNSDNSINVTWNAAADNGSGVAYYKVLRTPDWSQSDVRNLQLPEPGNFTAFYYHRDGTKRIFTDFWDSINTAYTYRVIAFDNAGNSTSTPASNAVSTPKPAPTPPPVTVAPTPRQSTPAPTTPPATTTPTQPTPTTPTQPEKPKANEPSTTPDPTKNTNTNTSVQGKGQKGGSPIATIGAVILGLILLGGALTILARRRMRENTLLVDTSSSQIDQQPSQAYDGIEIYGDGGTIKTPVEQIHVDQTVTAPAIQPELASTPVSEPMSSPVIDAPRVQDKSASPQDEFPLHNA